MRAADAVEKVTRNHFEFLQSHKNEIFDLLKRDSNIEFKWHLALLVARLKHTAGELRFTWNKLTDWAKDKTGSRIVRVNALESLYNLTNGDSKKLEQLG